MGRRPGDNRVGVRVAHRMATPLGFPQCHSNVASSLLVDQESTLLTLDEQSSTGQIDRSDDPPVALSETAHWDHFRERLNASFAIYRDFMEPAGLEPATSWVRSSEASACFEAKAAD